MLEINETLVAEDPVVALEGEYGVFELTPPKSGKFRVTCRPNRSITNLVLAPEAHDAGTTRNWNIRKIAELATAAGKTG